jgi:hypothetical protein
MIALVAIMPRILIDGAQCMTAYLISRSLVGLIALAVWEGLS